MFLQGLKINLSFHLVVLIALGMILVNFAMTTSFQKVFINREIAESDLLVSSVQSQFNRTFTPDKSFTPDSLDLMIKNIIKNSGYSSVVVLDENRQWIYGDEDLKHISTAWDAPVRRAMAAGEKTTKLIGKTWGVFWSAEEYLLVGFPLIHQDRAVAGVGMIYPLSPFYRALRQMQQLLWVFMAMSVVMLSLLGFYQLSKIAINPIYRLLRRAEEFQADDQFLFQHDDKSNEFRRLSFSLNQMLMRINRDKHMLKSTIDSLEKSNNELKQAQKEIIKSEKLASVGRLSAGIAHEIGNPIGIILGYFELLKKENIKNEDKAEFILRAEKETLRVKNIIRQLLDYTRPANEGIQTISTHALINDLIRMVSPQPIMENMDVRLDLRAKKDMVLGSPDLLLQVFLNLFVNASDAVFSSPDTAKGQIVISTENAADPKDVIVIKFEDNGIGISEQDRETLFDPFYTTKEPGKGTGLGLYVSFMIIENMGGKINITSESRDKTTIMITLKTVLNEITDT